MLMNSLAYCVEHDLPPMRPGAVLEEVKPLPGSQQGRSAADRYSERGLRQRGLDVRRHVVWPLGGMHDPVHALRNELAEEGVEVGPHVRIGVLLDQQRTRCMA